MGLLDSFRRGLGKNVKVQQAGARGHDNRRPLGSAAPAGDVGQLASAAGRGPVWASVPAELDKYDWPPNSPGYLGDYIGEYDPMRPTRAKQTGPVGVGAFERPGAGGLMIDASMTKPVIGKDEIRKAMLTLQKYKSGKANFEARVIENEQWWKLRHWEHMHEQGTTPLKTKSAWLVNVILSKHADAVDALPEPNCLPRAADDKGEALRLSKIVPVILKQNDFASVWSANWWKKLKAGVAFYGVFWDSRALNGLGEIAVNRVDPLSLFWEPGVVELQKSRNIFQVTLVDNEVLEEMYPELKGKLRAKSMALREYIHDDNVDTSEKSPVIDWYYKKQVGARTVLHFVKFVGENVLFATENEPELTDRGLYDHGMYPFFADVLFPEEDTPIGYGYVDICKDPQRQIDLMNNAIVANCIAAATPRWLKRGEGGVNEEEYLDWRRPFVHVNGNIDEAAMRQITVAPLPGNLLAILESKISEMKETSGNRDVNNGGTTSGVTAASAIAAMQEQSGKLSRDQIQGSYDCFEKMVEMMIELIRQFYDMPRQFRIVGADGEYQFVQYDNRGLQTVEQGPDELGLNAYMRKPVFDIEVSAQKQSAYNKLSYNELAIQLYNLGFFNPSAPDPALAALDMMDFKGKENVRARIQRNGDLMAAVQLLQHKVEMYETILGIAPVGAPDGAGQENEPEAKAPRRSGAEVKSPPHTNVGGEQTSQNRYIEKGRALAQAATQPR